MGLTTALFTGLSGLKTNSEAISVTGNNIANLNTTGFKASRVTFETQILNNLAAAAGPSAELGGTNPIQIGLGTRIGAITRNFNDGSLAPTGVATDMAIEGNGFFVLGFEGNQRYTRAGNFQLDRDFNFVNPDGGRLQGYGIDADFNVIEGVLTDLHLPVGVLKLAEATDSVVLAGNLSTDGDAAVNESILHSNALFGTDLMPVTDAAELLTDLRDGTAAPMFADGDIVSVTGITKGSGTLPDRTFEVGATNTSGSDANGATLQDLMMFLDDVLGIDNSVSGGVSLDARGTGEIVIQGNTGAVNDIFIDSGNIIVNESMNPTLPLKFNKLQGADGESVRTTFVGYDSLGSPLQVDVSIVLESKEKTGTTWRYYVQSKDDTDVDRVLGNGLLEFDTNGSFVSVSDPSFTIDRDGTGAFSPQQISLTFSSPDGSLSALADSTSQVTALRQNGSPLGTLQDFSVSEDGTIVGVFSNSLLRDLGRVTLAKFVNPVGLVGEGANLFTVSANSGIPAIVGPGTGGTGRIVGGTLELSNTELANEFINLINYSTGFTASSRVLTTTDRLIQELLQTVR